MRQPPSGRSTLTDPAPDQAPYVAARPVWERLRLLVDGGSVARNRPCCHPAHRFGARTLAPRRAESPRPRGSWERSPEVQVPDERSLGRLADALVRRSRPIAGGVREPASRRSRKSSSTATRSPRRDPHRHGEPDRLRRCRRAGAPGPGAGRSRPRCSPRRASVVRGSYRPGLRSRRPRRPGDTCRACGIPASRAAVPAPR